MIRDGGSYDDQSKQDRLIGKSIIEETGSNLEFFFPKNPFDPSRFLVGFLGFQSHPKRIGMVRDNP